MSDQFEIRIAHLKQQLLEMTESNGFKFDEHLHGNLPEKHGIYRFFSKVILRKRFAQAVQSLLSAD